MCVIIGSMKIVTIDTIFLYPEHVATLKKLGNFISYADSPKNTKEAIKRIKDADIIIDFWYPLHQKLVEKANQLKMVCVAATGYDFIDLETLSRKGIILTNCPNYSTEAVAEHTIGLLLAAARLSLQANADARRGGADMTRYKGRELRGKVLGIVGYGNIGKRVAEIAKNGFGMKIMFVNSQSSRKDFENLLKQSDFISIHTPLTEKTRGMFGVEEFNLMKQGVVLVNAARGAIIDEVALAQVLRSGKVFASSHDILVNDPPIGKEALFDFPNVVITPHISWNTQEADYNLSAMVVDNIKSFIEGKPQNVVNST